MRCTRCQYEVEDSFRFCPRCGARRRSMFAEPWNRLLQDQKALYSGIGLALLIFLGGLFFFAIRQQQLSNLKQGKRSGLEFAEALVAQAPSLHTLQQALGRPVQMVDLGSGRFIRWFQIADGHLGVESVGGILHFRPLTPLPLENLPARYRPSSEPTVVAGEVVSAHEGPDNLTLVTLQPEKRRGVVSEFILWRKG